RDLGCRNPDVYFRRVVLVEKSQPLPAGYVEGPDADIGTLDSARIWDRTNSDRAGNVWICLGAGLVRAAVAHRKSLALFARNGPGVGSFCVAFRYRRRNSAEKRSELSSDRRNRRDSSLFFWVHNHVLGRPTRI